MTRQALPISSGLRAIGDISFVSLEGGGSFRSRSLVGKSVSVITLHVPGTLSSISNTYVPTAVEAGMDRLHTTPIPPQHKKDTSSHSVADVDSLLLSSSSM